MNCRRLLIIGLFVLGLCLVVSLLGLAAYFLRGPSTVAGPVVAILAPDPGEQVRLGEVVAVHSTSRDEAHQVVKVELWVDGALIEVDTSPEGASALSIVQGWQPLSPGFHTILVRAFNEADVHGQATIGVETVLALADLVEERPSVPEDFPSVEEIMAGAPIPPESEVLPPPGGFPSDEEAEEPEDFRIFAHPDFGPLWEGARDPLVSAIIPGLLDLVLGGLAPIPPTMVEFAALDFEVQQDYEEIYCYASLSDGPLEVEKVPEHGFFRPASERHWNIAEHLGGQNSQLVAVPVGQSLRVFVDCSAFSSEPRKYLGLLDVSLPPEDWDGDIIRASGTGGEGFELDFSISVPKTGIPAPFNLQLVEVQDAFGLHWMWEGDQEQIHGFRIYRNNQLVESEPAGDRAQILTPLSAVPPCGEEFEYYVKAFRGDFGAEGVESPPSNLLLLEGSPCYGEDDSIEAVAIKQSLCSGAAQELEVDYRYTSDHGEASMGALAYNDGTRVSSIQYSSTRINHIPPNIGRAHVLLEYSGSGTLTTDELLVFMFDSDHRPFYVKRMAQNITWPEPQPDLSITYADVVEDLVRVRIQNLGCAPVDEPFTLKLVSPDVGVGGTATVAEIDTYLNPHETYVWETSDPVWANGFTATVDDDNRISESDEDNNVYERGAITLRAVIFYMVEIHDTSDCGDFPEDCEFGDFTFKFWVNDKFAYRPVGTEGSEVKLTVGLHELGGPFFGDVILSPELDWNEPLEIRIKGMEHDSGFNMSEVFWIDYTHSHDISQENSWKRGGEFHETSSGGCFSFYWRLILE